MNIKKTLLVLTVLLVGSTTIYADCSTVNQQSPKHAQYLCKRFVTITYSQATYQIDFGKVQTVFQDTHGHAKNSLTPTTPFSGNARHYYVVLDNGTWIFFDALNCSPKPADAWNAYKNFLIENPSFIGMR